MLNNLKIGTKLAVGFGVAVVLLLLLSIVSITNINSMDSNMTTIVHERFPNTIFANKYISAINEAARVVRNYMITDDPSVKAQEKERLTELAKIADAMTDSLKAGMKTDKGNQLLSEMTSIRKGDYYTSRSRFLTAVDLGNKEEATSILFGDLRKAQSDYINKINEMIDYQEQLMYEAGAEGDAIHSFVTTLTIILSILALIFVVAAAYVITKSITKPVIKLNEAALRVATGELRVNVDIKSNDEIGKLANSFNTMSDKITQTMEDLDGLPAPLMMIDPDFNITYFNKAAASVAGKDQKSVIGQKCYDQFKTEHCRTANCATHKAMLTKTPQIAETIARPTGTDIPIAYAAKANIDKNGNVIGALEFVTDLSKAKAQENYLNNNAQKMLVEMEKFALGDLSIGLKVENKEDIIGKLFTGFNQVVENIRNIIFKVTDCIHINILKQQQSNILFELTQNNFFVQFINAINYFKS